MYEDEKYTRGMVFRESNLRRHASTRYPQSELDTHTQGTKQVHTYRSRLLCRVLSRRWGNRTTTHTTINNNSILCLNLNLWLCCHCICHCNSWCTSSWLLGRWRNCRLVCGWGNSSVEFNVEMMRRCKVSTWNEYTPNLND